MTITCININSLTNHALTQKNMLQCTKYVDMESCKGFLIQYVSNFIGFIHRIIKICQPKCLPVRMQFLSFQRLMPGIINVHKRDLTDARQRPSYTQRLSEWGCRRNGCCIRGNHFKRWDGGPTHHLLSWYACLLCSEMSWRVSISR